MGVRAIYTQDGLQGSTYKYMFKYHSNIPPKCARQLISYVMIVFSFEGGLEWRL